MKQRRLLHLIIYYMAVAALVPALTGCRSSSTFVGEGQTFRQDNVAVRSEFCYKDYNTMTLEKAEKIGIRPLENRAEAARKVRRLKHITDTEYYKLDPMTHSMPYLAKGDTKLLKTIGKNFQKGLPAPPHHCHVDAAHT